MIYYSADAETEALLSNRNLFSKGTLILPIYTQVILIKHVTKNYCLFDII